MTALARDLTAYLSVPFRVERAPQRSPTLTLREVVSELPALGIRRVVLIALQLATELDLASLSGFVPGSISLGSVRMDRVGTPFEQALLPTSDLELTDDERPSQGIEGSLGELGALLLWLLHDKPLYLEESIRAVPPGAQPPLRRRADREVLNALVRALTLIAQHCRGEGARYTSTFDLTSDLSKLANITTRIVLKRHPSPVVSVHSPHPRMKSARRPLPKVIVRGALC